VPPIAHRRWCSSLLSFLGAFDAWRTMHRCPRNCKLTSEISKINPLTAATNAITISRKALHSHVEYCKSTKKRNNGVSIKIRAHVDCNTLSRVSYIVHRVHFISTASFNLESELPLPFFSDIKCNPPIMQIRVGSNEGRVIYRPNEMQIGSRPRWGEATPSSFSDEIRCSTYRGNLCTSQCDF